MKIKNWTCSEIGQSVVSELTHKNSRKLEEAVSRCRSPPGVSAWIGSDIIQMCVYQSTICLNKLCSLIKRPAWGISLHLYRSL